ncbi:MAG TPA: hypothetical protein VNX47_12800, partial [Nevskia sp.]|nr:hypothetical protein [Nevskia sp.]
MRHFLGLGACALALTLAACSGSSTPSSTSGGGSGTGGTPTVPVTASRAGKVYSTSILTPIGDTIWLTVFEPSQLVAGHSYPLVFTSEGYGGTRETKPDAFIQKLENNGYYVIYFD